LSQLSRYQGLGFFRPGIARVISQRIPVMTAKTSFRGSFTALVTPFKNGHVDEASFRGLVDWQIAEGTNGLVPVGTTGESPTLSHLEHKQVVEWCVDQAKGKVPVVAGAGSNSTQEAIDLSMHAEKAGADAVLVVTPYYNKPTQDGLYSHFKAINDAVGIPIIIYNIPGRSVIDMSVETMKRLFELKNIAGVKDATANMVRVSQQRAAGWCEHCDPLVRLQSRQAGFTCSGNFRCSIKPRGGRDREGFQFSRFDMRQSGGYGRK
jgi:hypothetical protein